jgi:hypothetical protein
MEFTTAWVADPELAVQADGHRYRHLRSSADRHVVSLEPSMAASPPTSPSTATPS